MLAVITSGTGWRMGGRAAARAAWRACRLRPPHRARHRAGLARWRPTLVSRFGRARLWAPAGRSVCGHEPGARGGLWRLLVVERDQRVSPASPGGVLARSVLRLDHEATVGCRLRVGRWSGRGD